MTQVANELQVRHLFIPKTFVMDVVDVNTFLGTAFLTGNRTSIKDSLKPLSPSDYLPVP